jgi:hypothetical protein
MSCSSLLAKHYLEAVSKGRCYVIVKDVEHFLSYHVLISTPTFGVCLLLLRTR